MAGLFGGAEAPQYVGPGGSAVPTKQSGGLFGVFPGTPDYASSSATTPTTDAPAPVPPASQAPGIEVSVKVPGLVNLQASLWVPPWLRESAPALVPILVQLLRQHLDAEVCRERPAPDCDRPAYGPSAEPGYARPETEARVWDRE